MKYINLTPRWTEIFPTMRQIVERVNSAKRNQHEGYNKIMSTFWSESFRMAQGADNFNDLVAYLRKRECWSDDIIEKAIKVGRELQETERTTVHESVE